LSYTRLTATGRRKHLPVIADQTMLLNY